MGIERMIGDKVWREFSEQILPSIVCIRNESTYEIPQVSKLTGRPMVHLGMNTGFGTGCIYSRQKVKGRTESLILTNHHVPYNAPVQMKTTTGASGVLVNTGKLFRERFHIVENAFDGDLENAAELEFIRHKRDGDAAIMRTIGGPELPRAKFTFGVPGGVSPGETLLSTGFPYGQTQIVTSGIITSTEYWDMAAVPVPTRVYLADLKIDAGQSGSPVFVPRQEGKSLKFYCVGLMYAGADDDTTRMIMPYEQFSEIITGDESVPSARPSLNTPVTLADTASVFRKGSRTLMQSLADNRYELSETEGNKAVITAYRTENDHVVDNERIDIELTFNPELHVGRVTYIGHGATMTLDTSAESEDLRVRYDALFTAAVNYFKTENLHNQKVAVKSMKPAQKREVASLERTIGEYSEEIVLDLLAFYADLRLRGITPREF